MKICSVCGTQNDDAVDYCEDCGADISSVALDQALDQVENDVDATPIEVSDLVEAVESEEVAEPVDAEPAEVTDASSPEDTDTPDTGAYLVVVSTGDKIPLVNPETVIGREDPISNIFPDIDTTPFGGLEGGVSRKHAKITQVDDQYHIEDLSSTNYTLVNKEKLEPATPRKLAAGDEIRLGRVALLFML